MPIQPIRGSPRAATSHPSCAPKPSRRSSTSAHRTRFAAFTGRSFVKGDARAAAEDDEAVGWVDNARVPLLDVSGLVATYPDRALRRQAVRALDDVSFALGSHETLGIVGESGSGKTTHARCIVGLHRPAAGTITFAGTPLRSRAIEREADTRRRIQIVFQNPDGSLNPRSSVAQIIERPLQQFFGLRGLKLHSRALELLELVRLPRAALRRYPRDLSGGEKQRVAIAAALAPGPDVVICDEITSALDVSVQAAIIELLIDLGTSLGTSFLFISHDLAVVRAIADRVLVLQNGEIREQGDADAVFRSPKDPYTQALLRAVPEIRFDGEDAIALR
jgi:peptide/nickel transport system ATP-binding protein